MLEPTLCACKKMYHDARIDTNSLWIGDIMAPQIHPYTPTDSPCFGNLIMTISFIHNFLTICPIRSRFSMLLDHNSVYIVHKWKLSACVTFYSAPVSQSLRPEPRIRSDWRYKPSAKQYLHSKLRHNYWTNY